MKKTWHSMKRHHITHGDQLYRSNWRKRPKHLICIFALLAFCLAGLAPLSPVYSQNASSAELSDLNQRVGQIEEKLRDLQIVIGSLESLVKQQQAGTNQGAASSQGQFSSGQSSGFSGSGDRIEILETQIRAMSSQIEHLTLQMQNGRSDGSSPQFDQRHGQDGQGQGGDAHSTQGLSSSQQDGFQTRTEENTNLQNNSQTSGQTAQQSLQEPDGQQGSAQGLGLGSSANGTGSNSTGAGNDLSSTQMSALPDIAPNQEQQGSANGQTDPDAQTQSVQAGGPETIYNEAYGHLLRRDYGTAASGFQKFLKSHGKDKLAGNAQYWLGETYFAQGDYKKAADSFLKGYTKFKSSQKAPDSLLKLALSLEKLGQKDAACSSISELNNKFPQAADTVKKRAETEKKRIGCS